jgi:hypothetical protein
MMMREIFEEDDEEDEGYLFAGQGICVKCPCDELKLPQLYLNYYCHLICHFR